MEHFSNMIDENFEIINDMGTAPVVAAMVDALGISQAINNFVGVPDVRTKVDVGTLIKALIINMLYGRTPLVHVQESFKHLDCEVLFGEGLFASDFNDDRLGEALEKVGNLDFHKLYSEICVNALELHNATAEQVHVDTTNISVYGEYKSSEEKDFKVTFGDPKSKRRDLKQLNIGLFVQQNGLPIGGNALSGNTSDVVWFRDALEELNATFFGDLYTMPICIFDAAGSNDEMFKKANNLATPVIIRLSDRFNLMNEHVKRAWEENQWTLVNNKGELMDKETGSDLYKMRSFDISIDNYDWRLIVVYSSALKKSKEATAKRNYPKQKEKLEKSIKKLEKMKFKTYEEANQMGTEFIKKNIGLKMPFKYTLTIEEKLTEKYSKAGKPTKTSEKTVTTEYYVNITIGERDEELYAEWLKKESCFVLISNVPKDRCSDLELFREYKEQWVVEDKFKFLKQPVILGPIWLQKQERIKGLVFVLLLSVLVSMFICYRCAMSIQGVIDENENILTKDVNSCKPDIESQGNNSSASQQSLNKTGNVINSKPAPRNAMSSKQNLILTTDGRFVGNPTYKTIKKLLDPIKTIKKLDSQGNIIRKFAYGTEGRLLNLVEKIGFSPKIYLEKFTIGMDLWSYKRGKHIQTSDT